MANTLIGRLTPTNNMGGTLTNESRLTGQLGGVGAVVTYASLPDKPSINNVELVGNKTTSDLNISYNDLRDKPVIPDVGEIDERLDDLEGDITSLGGRVTTAEGDITSLGGRVTTAEGNITTLQGDTGALDTRLTTAEGDITSLGGRLTTAEGNITSLGGRVTTAEGNITSLGGRVTTTEGNITALQGDTGALDTRLTTAEGDITSLGGRVTTTEGNITTLQGDMSQAQSDITQLNSRLSNLIKIKNYPLTPTASSVVTPYSYFTAYQITDIPTTSTIIGLVVLSGDSINPAYARLGSDFVLRVYGTKSEQVTIRVAYI